MRKWNGASRRHLPVGSASENGKARSVCYSLSQEPRCGPDSGNGVGVCRCLAQFSAQRKQGKIRIEHRASSGGLDLAEVGGRPACRDEHGPSRTRPALTCGAVARSYPPGARPPTVTWPLLPPPHWSAVESRRLWPYPHCAAMTRPCAESHGCFSYAPRTAQAFLPGSVRESASRYWSRSDCTPCVARAMWLRHSAAILSPSSGVSRIIMTDSAPRLPTYDVRTTVRASTTNNAPIVGWSL